MSGKGSPTRGSAKFKFDIKDHRELVKALDLSRFDFEVKRWWKYGQPAIDRITATYVVKAGGAGELLNVLLGANSDRILVRTRAFPFGMPDPFPDGVEIDVEFIKNV